jgi:hypothetical protein
MIRAISYRKRRRIVLNGSFARKPSATERLDGIAIGCVSLIAHRISLGLHPAKLMERTRLGKTMTDIIAEYRSLLTAEESLAALDRTVEFSKRVAQGGRILDGQRWPNILAAGGAREQPLRSAAAQRVLDVATLLRSLPPRAENRDIPEAQYALLMDTLFLVFHQAYFSLLPKAASHRKTLLQAFDAFADELPNLADRFQTKGLLHLECISRRHAVRPA